MVGSQIIKPVMKGMHVTQIKKNIALATAVGFMLKKSENLMEDISVFVRHHICLVLVCKQIKEG